MKQSRAERVHIAIYGRTNSGKSSLINAITGQDAAIVSDIAGTTTDPVSKSMEVPALGAVTFIDTAGFGDNGALGGERAQRTRRVADRTDVAIIVIAPRSNSPETSEQYKDSPKLSVHHKDSPKVSVRSKDSSEISVRYGDFSEEMRWIEMFRERRSPLIVVINKADIIPDMAASVTAVETLSGLRPIPVSAKTGAGINLLISAISQVARETDAPASILGDMVSNGDVVVLVMPQDSQAPHGRLILPQVQVIRELLDRKCIAISCVPEEMENALKALTAPPKLVITDSQVFDRVSMATPAESRLTSFSVLMAHYKGDVRKFVEGAAMIDRLTAESRVLIAEACTHAPATEDIGRVKIPAMLRKRVGNGLRIDVVGGSDFPEDLTPYDLIIHCGACMFNRSHVLSRIEKAVTQNVPITNYGIAIAYLASILDKISYPGKQS